MKVNCLNPYYTGRWFLLYSWRCYGRGKNKVLILIILEDGFCLQHKTIIKNIRQIVLILIILEDGFCLITYAVMHQSRAGLNPYYTGRWFLLNENYNLENQTSVVLILIILEDGFCLASFSSISMHEKVLILIILEDGFC